MRRVAGTAGGGASVRDVLADEPDYAAAKATIEARAADGQMLISLRLD